MHISEVHFHYYALTEEAKYCNCHSFILATTTILYKQQLNYSSSLADLKATIVVQNIVFTTHWYVFLWQKVRQAGWMA